MNTKEINPKFELSKDGEIKFTGSENDCYIKLQRLQSQSSDWAMKNEGWAINPVTEPKIYTRKQLLNKECTHRQYYAQFVNEGLKNLVNRWFSTEELTKAIKEDEHLNSIPLHRWDACSDSVKNSGFGLSAQLKERGDGLSLAGLVCICKEAARQIIESSKP
jgi:hypothetical protein